MTPFYLDTLPKEDAERLKKAIGLLNECTHELWMAFFKNTPNDDIVKAYEHLHDASILLCCVSER